MIGWDKYADSIDWDKCREKISPTDKTCAIRNDYNGTYLHKTLFSVLLFPNRKSAQRYISRHGLSPKFYKVVEVNT